MTMTRIFQASSSLTTPDIATDTETETQLSLPWHVVVLNDPVNLMSYVVVVFCKVFGFTHEKARKHMLEVHQLGRTRLWSGEREKAEAYTQTLHQWQLTAILERDD